MAENERKSTEVAVYPKSPEKPSGWLEVELPNFVMTKLQSYIESAKKNPESSSSNLVGNISKSLYMKDKDDWFFRKVLDPLISKFEECYQSFIKGVSILTEDAPFSMNRFWVNFQKQHEFNPPHDHTGLFSFVIFVKIPTDWREQHALPISANSGTPCASDFEFHYTTMLGGHGVQTYLLDKTSEGLMLFFPAKLIHCVYPFYNCNEERISISGNICIDISENSMRQIRGS